MICKVKASIDRYEMLRCGSRVIVALSGGADSVALLHCLLALREKYEIELVAAHVNHGLRGADADSDEAFVKTLCERLGVPLHVLHADVSALAKERGVGLEECGRQVRYEYFRSIDPDATVATAHNLNDRVETVIFNLTRGSALPGLCSIPAVRGNIIRPLIDCSRAEIEAFCAENTVGYVTDKTNNDVLYSRNRIRLNVIPELRQINPSLEQSVRRCVESLSDDNDLLDCLANELVVSAKTEVGYDAKTLFSAHRALKNRAVAAVIKENTGVSADNATVLAVSDLLETGGQIQIAGGAFVRVRKGILDFPIFCDEADWRYDLNEGINTCGNFAVSLSIINTNETNCLQTDGCGVVKYTIDYGKVGNGLFVRNRREGDAVRLAGRACTQKLRKLFNEKGIAPEIRNRVAVVCDSDGIVAVEGFGVCERCKVTDKTENKLRIEFRRDSDA